jgi:hypothetical protein
LRDVPPSPWPARGYRGRPGNVSTDPLCRGTDCLAAGPLRGRVRNLSVHNGNAVSVETSQAAHDTLSQATGTAGTSLEGQILTIRLAPMKTPRCV